VQADVDVKILVISGVLVGTVRASESVRLTDKARVVGDIHTPRLVMEAGAAYRGRIDMGEGANVPARKSTAAARPAPPRMQTPARAAAPATVVRAPTSPAAPPRVSAPPRPSAPPSLPRPDVAAAAGAGAPAWAKKKLRRR
jgi:hypothetical protein